MSKDIIIVALRNDTEIYGKITRIKRIRKNENEVDIEQSKK